MTLVAVMSIISFKEDNTRETVCGGASGLLLAASALVQISSCSLVPSARFSSEAATVAGPR